MRSVMEHSFSEVPRAEIPRSSFNRSHGIKTTFDADYLIPILVDDVVPGDTFNVDFNFFGRLATPIYPIMDNLYLDTFFFFVPYRLVWENWERMHGAQDNPDDSIDFTVPVISGSSDFSTGSLFDYAGLPIGINANESGATALPFRAYNLIWNEWFRDQNLQDSVTVQTGNGPDSVSSLYSLLKRGKRHDYFTSCLPWPQKGDAVSLPLGLNAGVIANVNDPVMEVRAASGETADRTFSVDGSNNVSLSSTAGTGTLEWAQGYKGSTSNPQTGLVADLSTATAATINDLRLAFQTQRLLERDARSGTRYRELILSHYGVTVPDFRVQDPEFLGGGSSPMNISPVAQTSGQPTPAANDKLGELAAIGTVSGSHGFTKSFTEHGIIIGLMNVRGDITYSQGIERYWNKQTRYDFYYPVLAQIGEQSVLNKEIYADGTSADNDVFGYQERYAEYRYKPSRLMGLFRPDAAASLDAWHLSEDFSSLPVLNDTFIQSNTGGPLDRAIAIPTEPHIILDGYFNMQCARPMPLFGVPGNLDHF